MITILIVPGLGGSGPQHWQSRWLTLYRGAMRVEQQSWDAPELHAWCAGLEAAVQAAPGQVLLVAHSLGAVLVAHWAEQLTPSLRKVHGALLVAPPDVESEHRVPALLQGFAPIPRRTLPFTAIVVGSRDDEYACIDCPRQLAEAWGARFVDVGERGHINADSQLGDWDEGRVLLATLL